MAQLGNCDCLDLEPNAIVLVLGEKLGQDLDCDVAGKGLLVGLVHRSHAPASDLFDDQIRTKSRPRVETQAAPLLPHSARATLFSYMNEQTEQS